MKRKSRRIKKVCESHSNSHTAPPVTHDHHCLLNLVWWAHEHAGECSSRPGLQKVLEERCGGAVRAVWSCADGHSYIMDTSNTCRINRNNTHPQTHRPIRTSTDNVAHVNRDSPQSPAHRNAAQTQSSTHSHTHTDKSDGAVGADKVLSHVQPVEESDLSDRIFSSEEEEDEMMKVSTGSRANIHTDKKSHSSKMVMIPEPKERKKPGPKPGWKKKLKSEREDLPSIYKCPHQGCTAVYRGVDGMRKHVKEHHEEVKERPCPHPGCNKVFMIDRYLQRHIKLIHTEVRNYICDQCGQTFKQRKHLLVHQMRHSGAKPLHG
ncbi:zinc finger protein 276 isoform X2 [Trichomycterus rosablanca]|uniref:zinc finger protein 276 isoform X2 n=1 Tax=Trichomycterus rosablanca TaxID=2290929 RepID=UPI002F34F5F0